VPRNIPITLQSNNIQPTDNEGVGGYKLAGSMVREVSSSPALAGGPVDSSPSAGRGFVDHQQIDRLQGR